MTKVDPETKEKLVLRVMKMLAKADDPATTPEESDAFAQHAARMMLKYGISDKELKTPKDIQEELSNKYVEFMHPKRAQGWEQTLAGVIGRVFDCAVIRSSRYINSDWHKVAVFAGMDEDVDICIYFFTFLIEVCIKS